jgi:arginase
VTALDAPVHLIGVPFNSAGTDDGVALAPRALREAGLAEGIASTRRLVDHGDLPLTTPTPRRDPRTHIIAPEALAAMIPAVRARVAALLEAGGFPLVIGGDCPILLGCLGATGDGVPPGLLFVDGHEDAWPPQASTTGEAADMELGLALGLTVEGLPDVLTRELPRLDPARVVVIGARDQRELDGAGVRPIGDTVQIIRPERVLNWDPEVEAAIDRLSEQGPWWLHVDLDVLSTESLAAVDYPLPGGLAWADLERLTKRALATPGVIGWDVTIYNPDLDPDRSAAQRIVRYLGDSLSMS